MTSKTKKEFFNIMKDRNKTTAEKVTLNTLVVIGIVLTLIVLAALPFIVAAMLKHSDWSTLSPHIFGITVGSVYACAVPYLAALVELKRICSLLFTDEAFSLKTAAKFRNIGFCAVAELAVLVAVQVLLCATIKIYELMGLYYLPVFVVFFVCITACVLAFVMSGAFRRAAIIKEENDEIF